MKYVTLHWTGGTGMPTKYELSRYHFLVDENCEVWEGDMPPEANKSPLDPAIYVRHSGGFNSDNIGIGLCGMVGAQESPFVPGPHPVSMGQFDKGAEVAAEMCDIYEIPVKEGRVQLHSEILPFYGRGKYKWDVNWVEGMIGPIAPDLMGHSFRLKVSEHLQLQLSCWQRFWKGIRE